MTQHLVIFDFDGVLCNSLSHVWKMFKAFAAKYQFHKVPTKKAFCNLFLENFYTATEKLGFDICHTPALGEEMKQLLLQTYDPPLFSGMKVVVQKLAETYTLAIESSNYQEPMLRVLKKHDLQDSFKMIVGADQEFSKTKRLQHCLEIMKPKKALFVTDTVGDIREATIVGIPVIAVSWGYQSYPQLKKAQPLSVARTPQELHQKIREYFEP